MAVNTDSESLPLIHTKITWSEKKKIKRSHKNEMIAARFCKAVADPSTLDLPESCLWLDYGQNKFTKESDPQNVWEVNLRGNIKTEWRNNLACHRSSLLLLSYAESQLLGGIRGLDESSCQSLWGNTSTMNICLWISYRLRSSTN